MKRKTNRHQKTEAPLEDLSDATVRRLDQLRSVVYEARKSPARSLAATEDERQRLQGRARQLGWCLALLPVLFYFRAKTSSVIIKPLILKGVFYAFAAFLYALYFRSMTTLGPLKRIELEEWRWRQNRRAFLYRMGGTLSIGLALAGTNPGWSNINAQLCYAIGFLSLLCASVLIFMVHWRPRIYISHIASVLLWYFTLIGSNAIVGAIILRHHPDLLGTFSTSINSAILAASVPIPLAVAYFDRVRNDNVLLQRLSLELVRPQRLIDALSPEMEAARARLRAQHLLASLEKGEEYRVRVALAAYLAVDYGKPPKKMTATIISLIIAAIVFVIGAVAEDWVQTFFEPIKQFVFRQNK